MSTNVISDIYSILKHQTGDKEQMLQDIQTHYECELNEIFGPGHEEEAKEVARSLTLGLIHHPKFQSIVENWSAYVDKLEKVFMGAASSHSVLASNSERVSDIFNQKSSRYIFSLVDCHEFANLFLNSLEESTQVAI